jgi:hypothetical protein
VTRSATPFSGVSSETQPTRKRLQLTLPGQGPLALLKRGAANPRGRTLITVMILCTRSRVDCSLACGLDRWRTARSNRPPDFFQYRNRRKTGPHLAHIARSKSSRCNSHELCGLRTTAWPLLCRLGLRRREDQQDQQHQQDQQDREGQAAQADRLHLFRLEDQADQGRPSGRLFYRKPPDLPLRRPEATSE